MNGARRPIPARRPGPARGRSAAGGRRLARGPAARAGPTAASLARGALTTAGLTAAGLAAGCGDPVAVVGDIPGRMRVVAGIPETSGNTAEPTATASRLHDPVGLAIGEDGVLYVADERNSRVLSVTSSGRLDVLLDHGRCTGSGCLERPADVALDGAGGLLVSDPFAHRIWRIALGSGTAEIVAGTGEPGLAPDGAPAAGAALSGPSGLVVGPDGVVHFAERLAHRVRSVRRDGTLATLAGTGEAGFSGDGGPAAEARLDLPTGLALTGDALYVADAGNDRVRVVDLAAGTIATVAGNGVRGYGGDGGPARSAALNVPEDVAVTPDGATLYIADTRNHRVRAVRLAGGGISTYAGTGETDFTGDLLDAGATALSLPRGVVASAFGLLWVADTGHQVVWRSAVEF